MVRTYNENEIAIIHEGGKILARIMKELEREVRPGIKTKYLNKVAEDLVFSFRAQPSFKGFNGYPSVICTSINEEIVHVVPGDRELKEGDIVSLDLGIRYKGYCTDMAVTVPVGKITKEKEKLIKVTQEALYKGIEQAKPGNYLGDIGWAIQQYAESQGFNVVRELVGHGVGKEVHEDPQIPNYGEQGTGLKLVKGMVLAIEPMFCIGNWQIEKCEDGFGYRTKDRSLSAHFEHTIAVTQKGPKILTTNSM